MLTLIKGRNGSGKTSWCLSEIVKRAKEGKESVLLVRENLDYTFEVELVKRLEPAERRYCEVTNMKKLCRDIIRRRSGYAHHFLDDPEKITIIRKIVLKCADQLLFYKKKGRDSTFYGMLSQLFDELRNENVTPEDLRKIAESCRSDLSKQKFMEIALLLEQYEAELADSYFDNASEVEYAGKLLAEADLLKDKEVFIDGFFGFNAVTRKLIALISQSSSNTYVTIECSDNRSDKDNAFAATYKSAERLSEMYWDMFGTYPNLEVFPADDHTKPSGLINAEYYFGTGKFNSEGKEGLFLIKGSSIYDEVEMCADEIKRLTREESVQYRDIVILLRDPSRYQEAILRTFDRFGISYVFDIPETLEFAPCTSFLLSALEMARGIRTDSLLRLLKTGLCDITEEEEAVLESYVFVHGIEGEDWLKPFCENPEGMGSVSTDNIDLLNKTESARKKVVQWLEPFLSSSRKAVGAALIRNAYELLERCGGLDYMEKMNEPGRCDAQLSLDMVDRLYHLIGNDPLTRDEVSDLLKVMARSTKALQIPERIDAVVVGETNRPSFQSPQNVFVLGLNDGVFPRDDFEGVLFTLEERDLLYENEFYVTGAFDECVDMETYYLYHACSIATRRLYLSYAEKDHQGNELSLSAEVAAFVERLGLSPLEKKKEFGIVNTLTAKIRFADALSRDDGYLVNALEKSAVRTDCLQLRNSTDRKSLKIKDKDLSKKLAGENQRISSSKIDVFENCRFRFFARYLMNLQPLRKAELSPLEAGNYVHDVMEHMMKELNGDLLSVDENVLKLVCSRLSDEYMDNLVPAENRTKRMQAICDQIKSATSRLAVQLRKEQEQSEFRPVDFELSIGNNGEIRGTRYELEDGSTAVVEGKIDRVDFYKSNETGFVRVVDYKTGEKKFNLSDVWQGLNIQMLVYLFALKNHGKERYGDDLQVAGVLYMPSDPSPQTGENTATGMYTMNGLLLDDPKVLQAMEANGKGIFIPTKIEKGGNWKKASLGSLEEFGKLEKHIDELIVSMAQAIRDGDLEAIPARKGTEHDACKYCEYKGLCDYERVDQIRKIEKLDREKIFGEEN